MCVCERESVRSVQGWGGILLDYPVLHLTAVSEGSDVTTSPSSWLPPGQGHSCSWNRKLAVQVEG